MNCEALEEGIWVGFFGYIWCRVVVVSLFFNVLPSKPAVKSHGSKRSVQAPALVVLSQPGKPMDSDRILPCGYCRDSQKKPSLQSVSSASAVNLDFCAQ